MRLTSQGDPDKLTGTLTSPPFKAERSYLGFLLVGGNRPAELAVEILLGDQVDHSVTGTNSNDFPLRNIDIMPWYDKKSRLRLVDKAKGSWGSIGIERLILTDDAGPAQPLETLRDNGSMALVMLAPGAVAQAARGKAGGKAETPLPLAQEMAVRAPLVIPANGEIKTTVIIAWHFPRVHPQMAKLPDPRRWVAGKFADPTIATWGASYESDKACDNYPGTRWGAASETRSGWVEFGLGADEKIRRAEIIEASFPRTEEFAVEYRLGETW